MNDDVDDGVDEAIDDDDNNSASTNNGVADEDDDVKQANRKTDNEDKTILVLYILAEREYCEVGLQQFDKTFGKIMISDNKEQEKIYLSYSQLECMVDGECQ